MTKKIALGVTGSIAAYKSALICRLLVRRGLDIQVIMTANAVEFIGEYTFRTLTGHPVISSMFDNSGSLQALRHTDLATHVDLFAVAPATANCIGKFANGIADDFLSTFFLACTKSVLIAPAMNPSMYRNPAVEENIRRLIARNVRFVGPESGDTACGDVGPGRMSDPEVIVDEILALLGRNGDMQGKKILITAGPTREKIDPVRFISNFSTGRMGYALAEAAIERGAEVTLISGPVQIPAHACAKVISVTSAEEMKDAVIDHAKSADIVIMSAAVADWRPAGQYSQKWKKQGRSRTTLELQATPDILDILGKQRSGNTILVGFAAETENLLKNAREKCAAKNVDIIVANSVAKAGVGFGSESNEGKVIFSDGAVVDIPFCSKREMADTILDAILKIS